MRRAGSTAQISAALLCRAASVLIDGSPTSPPDRIAAKLKQTAAKKEKEQKEKEVKEAKEEKDKKKKETNEKKPKTKEEEEMDAVRTKITDVVEEAMQKGERRNAFLNFGLDRAH